MTKAGRGQLAVALLAAILVVPATYTLLRGYDVLFTHEANPATVIASSKTAIFWRLGVGAYAGGMAAPLAFLAARADVARTVRVLARATMVVAAMIAAQGLLLP